MRSKPSASRAAWRLGLLRRAVKWGADIAWVVDAVICRVRPSRGPRSRTSWVVSVALIVRDYSPATLTHTEKPPRFPPLPLFTRAFKTRWTTPPPGPIYRANTPLQRRAKSAPTRANGSKDRYVLFGSFYAEGNNIRKVMEYCVRSTTTYQEHDWIMPYATAKSTGPNSDPVGNGENTFAYSVSDNDSCS